MFDIEMLPADEGDAIWIEYGPDDGPIHRVLVDCGRKPAYRAVRKRLEEAASNGSPLDFDLFVLTHVDDDHIYGAVPLLGDPHFDPDRVGDVWFNGWRHLDGRCHPPSDALGPQKGEFFAALLDDRGFTWNKAFEHWPARVPETGSLPTHPLAGGMQVTLLSPTTPCLDAMRDEWRSKLADMEPGDHEHALELLADAAGMQPDALGKEWLDAWSPDDLDAYATSEFEEDDKPANGSSIAVLAEYDGKRVVLAGDAFPSVVLSSLRRYKQEHEIRGPLSLAAFKVPHHGSENNLDADLVAEVACGRWLLSTNGKKHHHPHPNAIARIIAGSKEPELYFNYRSPESSVWDDDTLQDGRFTAHYGRDGFRKISL